MGQLSFFLLVAVVAAGLGAWSKGHMGWYVRKSQKCSYFDVSRLLRVPPHLQLSAVTSLQGECSSGKEACHGLGVTSREETRIFCYLFCSNHNVLWRHARDWTHSLVHAREVLYY